MENRARELMESTGFSKSAMNRSMGNLRKAMTNFRNQSHHDPDKAVEFYLQAIEHLGPKHFPRFINDEANRDLGWRTPIGIKCRMHAYMPKSSEEARELNQGRSFSRYGNERPNHSGDEMSPFQETAYRAFEDSM